MAGDHANTRTAQISLAPASRTLETRWIYTLQHHPIDLLLCNYLSLHAEGKMQKARGTAREQPLPKMWHGMQGAKSCICQHKGATNGSIQGSYTWARDRQGAGGQGLWEYGWQNVATAVQRAMSRWSWLAFAPRPLCHRRATRPRPSGPTGAQKKLVKIEGARH